MRRWKCATGVWICRVRTGYDIICTLDIIYDTMLDFYIVMVKEAIEGEESDEEND